MTLDQMSPQTLVQIVAVNGKGLLRRRLLEMGLTPHTFVKIRKVASMGEPIEVYLRSYVLTLRKEDASLIEVKVVEHD